MKNKYIFCAIIYSLFIIILSTACQKEKIELPKNDAGNQEFGWAKAKRNGDRWEASVICYEASNRTHMYCRIYTYKGDYFIKESLFLGRFPIAEGRTELSQEEDIEKKLVL